MQNKLIVYYHPIVVEADDLDELNHVNNVVYLRWVQEAAAAHWNHAAPGSVKEKYKWVVLRHEIDYHRSVFLTDKLKAKTWVDGNQGARSVRVVQLLKEDDNQLLAEARTTWCLLDAKTNRPVRVGEEIINIFE